MGECVLANLPGIAHVADEPSQLEDLIDAMARARETLGAAELDLRDRQKDEAESHERTMRAEAELSLAVTRAEEAERAVHRRIRAMTKSSFEDELTNDRCSSILILRRKD